MNFPPGRVLGILGFCAALTACSSPPPPPPPGIVNLTIKADATVNPDAGGRASPISVQIYQLASDAKFGASDFFQLTDKDTATLGPDLVNREAVILSPGETRAVSEPLKPNGRFVAVTGSFRDIDRAQWRAIIEVPPNGTTELDAKLTGLTLTLAKHGS